MSHIIGKDVTFDLGNGDGPPETFTVVQKCKTVTTPTRKWNFEDGVFHGQSDLAMRMLATLFDEGEASIELTLDPAVTEHVTLFNRCVAATNGLNSYRFTFGTFKTATFEAWVSSSSLPSPKGEHVKLNITFKLDGPAVWAAA